MARVPYKDRYKGLVRICKHCGGEFSVDYLSRPQQFCSRACVHESLRYKGSLVRVCEHCSTEFLIDHPSDPQRFCSRTCSQRHIVRQGEQCWNYNGGITKHPLYSLWRAMHQRCSNPSARDYELYGGRGIIVCKRWSDFWLFIEDMGERPEGLSLDRINSDGPYSPENCRWATWNEQRRNQRNCDTRNRGENNASAKLTWAIVDDIRSSELSVRELATKYGRPYHTIYNARKEITWKEETRPVKEQTSTSVDCSRND